MNRIIFLLILTFFNNNLLGQTTFEKMYGSSNYEEIWDSKLFSDSTVILAGYTGFGNAYFIKANLNGDTIWTKELIDPGLDLIYTIVETNDNGIIAAGRTSSFSVGALDIFLVKLDKNGSVLWRKSIGGIGDDTANEIKQTFDNGFIIVGNTYSFGAGSGNDFYIVKTDSIGNIIWTKTIGNILNDNAYSVFETTNHDIVITGLTTENNNVDVMVARLDQNGLIKWVNKYGGNGDDRGNSIIENNNQELIVNGLYDGDILLMKLDSLGNVIWSKTYGGIASDWGYSVKETKSNNLIFCGYQQLPSFGPEFLIVKTDQSGDTLWAKNYGNNNNQYATNIEENFDNTIFVTGYSQVLSSDYDYFLVKTDSLGRTSCTNRNAPINVNNLSLTAVPKVYTTSSGGSSVVGTQSESAFCNINVLCQSLLAVTEMSKEISVKVYPNPASDIINVIFNNNGFHSLRIINFIGATVYSENLTDKLTCLDVSSLSKGIYLLNISDTNNTMINFKLIIE